MCVFDVMKIWVWTYVKTNQVMLETEEDPNMTEFECVDEYLEGNKSLLRSLRSMVGIISKRSLKLWGMVKERKVIVEPGVRHRNRL